MNQPQSILVRAPNWIGDQILAYPFFYFLRKAFPSARIGVACVPWVRAIQFQDLVDDVFVLPQARENAFLAKWDAVEKGAQILKQRGPWDLGICLPNSFSSAWLLYRAGAKVRRGYSADGRRILLNESLIWDSRTISHRSEAYARLLPEVAFPKRPVMEFWGVPPENDLDPGIPGVLERFDAEKEWPYAEPIEPPPGPFWILAPGTTAESRRWPMEHFAELARQVAGERGWTGIVVGGPAESSIAEKWASDPSLKLLDWTAKGTATSYWKIFQQAKFSVTNDSGLAHVASLCGSPVQVVWGAGNPNRTEPMGPGKVQVIFNPVDCWPCERNTCSQETLRKFECLKGISPHAVWNEIKTGIRP